MIVITKSAVTDGLIPWIKSSLVSRAGQSCFGWQLFRFWERGWRKQDPFTLALDFGGIEVWGTQPWQTKSRGAFSANWQKKGERQVTCRFGNQLHASGSHLAGTLGLELRAHNKSKFWKAVESNGHSSSSSWSLSLYCILINPSRKFQESAK